MHQYDFMLMHIPFTIFSHISRISRVITSPKLSELTRIIRNNPPKINNLTTENSDSKYFLSNSFRSFVILDIYFGFMLFGVFWRVRFEQYEKWSYVAIYQKILKCNESQWNNNLNCSWKWDLFEFYNKMMLNVYCASHYRIHYI